MWNSLNPNSICGFTDGSSYGNPGPAGAGVLLQDPKDTVIHLSQHLGTVTNNVAELRAVWVACDELYDAIETRRMDALPVFLFIDNQYTIRAADGVTRVKANINKKLVHSNIPSNNQCNGSEVWWQ